MRSGRRRMRARRLAALGALVLAAGVLLGVLLPAPETPSGLFEGAAAGDAASPAPVASPDAPVGDGGDFDPDEAPVPPTGLLARHDGLDLHQLSPHALLVGFHEASLPKALALEPVGTLQANENTTKFEPPPDDPDGPDYLVLASRGRVQPATSAADVVLAEDDAVRSPVDGRVVDVKPYRLYNSYEDTRIEIVPDEREDLRVVLIHLDGVQVSRGDEVVAGVTPLAATGKRFPFSSNIDRYLDPQRHPHVHLEVKRTRQRRGR